MFYNITRTDFDKMVDDIFNNDNTKIWRTFTDNSLKAFDPEPNHEMYTETVEKDGKKEKHLFVRFFLYVNKEDIKATFKDDVLTVKVDSSKETEEEREGREWIRKAKGVTKMTFARTFQNKELVDCFYRDGVLTVEFRDKDKTDDNEGLIAIRYFR